MRKFSMFGLIVGILGLSFNAGALSQGETEAILAESARVISAISEWSGDNRRVVTPGINIGLVYELNSDKLVSVIKTQYGRLGFGEIDQNRMLTELNRVRNCHWVEAKPRSDDNYLETSNQPRLMCDAMTVFTITQAIINSRK